MQLSLRLEAIFGMMSHRRKTHIRTICRSCHNIRSAPSGLDRRGKWLVVDHLTALEAHKVKIDEKPKYAGSRHFRRQVKTSELVCPSAKLGHVMMCQARLLAKCLMSLPTQTLQAFPASDSDPDAVYPVRAEIERETHGPGKHSYKVLISPSPHTHTAGGGITHYFRKHFVACLSLAAPYDQARAPCARADLAVGAAGCDEAEVTLVVKGTFDGVVDATTDDHPGLGKGHGGGHGAGQEDE
ncbi:hypothetical protein GGX14DRAFT_395901 [Mycena pura]|uniref:Uncharacterized protein n=1 Tax=Mycena pura TaxID=153505 RepID=A0AAD6VIS2_9AGAR|nr:hypothetical protein GGX14DRAFT_395901 [Mycena pura]